MRARDMKNTNTRSEVESKVQFDPSWNRDEDINSGSMKFYQSPSLAVQFFSPPPAVGFEVDKFSEPPNFFRAPRKLSGV